MQHLIHIESKLKRKPHSDLQYSNEDFRSRMVTTFNLSMEPLCSAKFLLIIKKTFSTAKYRLEEINRKRELDIRLQAKRHEILVAQKLERESRLGVWLKSAAQPSLLWLPKFHNEDTQLLLEQRQADLEAWKVRRPQMRRVRCPPGPTTYTSVWKGALFPYSECMHSVFHTGPNRLRRTDSGISIMMLGKSELHSRSIPWFDKPSGCFARSERHIQ